MPVPSLPRQFTRGRQRVQLLDLEVAGTVLHLSTRPVPVQREDGSTIRYVGGLEPITWTEEIATGGDLPDRTEVTVEAVVQGQQWATLVSRRHDLSGGRGELSEWVPGISYERRRRLLVGRVTDPRYHLPGAAFACGLVQDPGEDQALVPSGAEVIDDISWPNADSNAVGKAYPYVFGAPGGWTSVTGGSRSTSGTRAYLVDTTGGSETLLLTGHTVAATSVGIFDADGNFETFTVSHMDDGRGHTCAVVDITAAATISKSSSEYWVAWKRNTGGGMVLRSGQAMEGAGDILRWLLRRCTVPVDLGRVDAVRDVLNRWILAGAIGSQTSPWDVVTEHLLPLMPVQMAMGPDGMYPVLTRGSEVQAELRTSDGLVPVGEVSALRDDQELVAEVQLSYARRARTNDYRRRVLLGPSPRADGDVETIESALARHAYQRYQRRRYELWADRVPPVPVRTFEAQWVYLRRTAVLAARNLLREGALSGREAVYEDPTRRYDRVLAGHTVRLFDSARGFDGVLAFVRSTSETTGSRRFVLEVDDTINPSAT